MTPMRARVPSKKERKKRNRVGKACRRDCGGKYNAQGYCPICFWKTLEKAENEFSSTLSKPQRVLLYSKRKRVKFLSRKQLRLLYRIQSMVFKWEPNNRPRC